MKRIIPGKGGHLSRPEPLGSQGSHPRQPLLAMGLAAMGPLTADQIVEQMGINPCQFFHPVRVSKKGCVGIVPKHLKQICLVAVLALAGSGCAVVGPRQQRLVSKPDMVFSQLAFLSYQNPLLEQVEPGSAFCGGAQPGGCTSCK